MVEVDGEASSRAGAVGMVCRVEEEEATTERICDSRSTRRGISRGGRGGSGVWITSRWVLVETEGGAERLMG